MEGPGSIHTASTSTSTSTATVTTTSMNNNNMNDMNRLNAYTELYSEPRLYDESFIHGGYGERISPDPQSCLQSEPLSRYASSDGSSYASSTPASPMPSSAFYAFQTSPPRNSPYHQYQEMTTPATSYYGSPDLGTAQEYASMRRISEDSQEPASSSYSGRDYPVCCLHPGCDAKPFKRRADLDRHYKHKHAPASLKESYHCDYPRCGRRRDPFHRRDHFRDHLRDFHKEDIEKRGVSVKEEWFEGRNAAHTWWRCTKCLQRIYISRYGYECPNCKTSCQGRRKEIRRRD